VSKLPEEDASKKCKDEPKECCGGCEKPALWGRRDLITLLSWSAMLGSGAAVSMGLLRFMFPKVLFEPSLIFKAGHPSEYTIGTVDTRWVKDQRVWLVRESNKMYAVSAICTHLGCTPVWLNNEDKFKCPCHGSGFYRTGLNYEGPAPRALERLKISVAEDGQIVVDRGKKFLLEKNDWDNPESYIVV
jgi:cytochrome b6-f complex iron-sulfur subunit